MKINSLSLEDFRGIHQLTLELGGKSTILFGINGVGKSTILAGINSLYASIINRIVRQRFKQSVPLELSDIKYKKASARVSADFIFEDDMILHYFRSISYDNKKTHSLKGLEELTAYFENRYIGKTQVDEENNLLEEAEKFNMPIFINYGVNRLVLSTPLRIRKRESFTPYSAFEKAIENQIAFGKLFEWFLEMELYEVQQRRVQPEYEDIALRSVKKAMLAMLDGYHDIHIEARPYSMKITKDNDVLNILQLSDGEKCTLALFGDIARRLTLANPMLDNPLEGLGVVLIDEVELHMHTSWQRKVVSVLKGTFPNIQFIITTHSPMVLGETGSDFHVFSLSREQDDIACNGITSLFGLDSNTVLEDALGTDSLNHEIKIKIDLMYSLVEQKEYDKAEAMADIIDELTKNRNADTVRARLMMRKGRGRNAQN